MNSTVDGTDIVYPASENISIAVDTERGLLTPVLRDAASKNIAQIAHEIADLAARTRDNKLKPDELAGGTFTLTNTGSRGALFDTPVVFLPQSAILGTGTVVKRPGVVTVDGQQAIAMRSYVYLALSYDHRIDRWRGRRPLPVGHEGPPGRGRLRCAARRLTQSPTSRGARRPTGWRIHDVVHVADPPSVVPADDHDHLRAAVCGVPHRGDIAVVLDQHRRRVVSTHLAPRVPACIPERAAARSGRLAASAGRIDQLGRGSERILPTRGPGRRLGPRRLGSVGRRSPRRRRTRRRMR